MEDTYEPKSKTEEVVLRTLNGLDALLVGLSIINAIYNFVRFVMFGKIYRGFIIIFYLLVLFCLASWEITAIAQAVNIDTRYLVFQKLDNPSYYQVTADISQTTFIGLFALVSATMYHIDQSLSLLLPNSDQMTAHKILGYIKIYNTCIFCLAIIYFLTFLFIFFYYDILAWLVLSIDLGFRITFLIIYTGTVF